MNILFELLIYYAVCLLTLHLLHFFTPSQRIINNKKNCQKFQAKLLKNKTKNKNELSKSCHDGIANCVCQKLTNKKQIKIMDKTEQKRNK